MFRSTLAFQGKKGFLFDSSEKNPQPLRYFYSRARDERMLGSARANVEMFWVSPRLKAVAGQILCTAAGDYFLVVKVEHDANIVAPVQALDALNALHFTTQLSGYATVPLPAASLNVFGEAPGGLAKTPKTVRVMLDLTSSIFSESTAGVLPSGSLTALTALGSGVALSDEYLWNGATWRVDQVNPVEAAGSLYGLQVLMKKAMTQRTQIT